MLSNIPKGPWYWSIDDKDIYIGVDENPRRRNSFARVDYDDVDHDEAEAVAQAISALPELIDALREAVTWDSHDSEGVEAVWLSKALAALAKAGA